MANQYREARTPVSSGKKLDHIRISEGEEGGHTVEHHYSEDGMMYHKPKQYSFGKDEGNDLLDHVRKHMHISGKADESGRDSEKEMKEA